jgi:hypothetical protein
MNRREFFQRVLPRSYYVRVSVLLPPFDIPPAQARKELQETLTQVEDELMIIWAAGRKQADD